MFLLSQEAMRRDVKDEDDEDEDDDDKEVEDDDEEEDDEDGVKLSSPARPSSADPSMPRDRFSTRRRSD